MRSFKEISAEVGYDENLPQPDAKVVFHGYAKGKRIGTFISRGVAESNGAKTTERDVENADEIAAFKLAKTAKYNLAIETWYTELVSECVDMLKEGILNPSQKDDHHYIVAARKIISYVENRGRYTRDDIADYSIEQCDLIVDVINIIT